LTGYKEARDAALAADFDRHIAKPVDPQAVLELQRPEAKMPDAPTASATP